MHVCMVHRDIHAVTRGGICTVYRALAKRLARAGHEVTLVTQETPHPVRDAGLRVIYLPRTDDMEAHRPAVMKTLMRIGPTVVDCSTWEAETLDYLRLPRHERAPVVVRGDLSARTMGVAELAAAEGHLVRLADQVVAVSDFAACDLATAYNFERPVTLPNGVDRERYCPGPTSLPASGFRVYLDAHGNVAERTPLDRLIGTDREPAPWARDPYGRLRLIWVGKISPMKGWDRLERLATRVRGMAHITVLLGHSRAYCPVTVTGRGDVTILRDLHDTDLPGFYRAADFLLSTSRWEGFGLAVAEALACTTPVLLPAGLGTAPELLDAAGGLTYGDGDHLVELLRTGPAISGRLPARFDWDANVDATLAIYRALGDRREGLR
jgi:D-inositol-3-phosphate glycosyltransferase